MNKKYDRTDSERDQLRRLEQDEAAKQQQKQRDKPAPGQQQARDEARRQHGAWGTEKDGRDTSALGNRDGDSGKRIVDEP